MRLIRFGQPGREKPGLLLDDQTRRDCSGQFADWNAEFFAAGGLSRLAEYTAAEAQTLPVIADGERWGAPIARPGKVICIGKNYAAHAKEFGGEVPPEPLIFMKAPSAMNGPYDPILIPRGSGKTDWEVELGVVIGRSAHYLDSETDALDCVAGYCAANDVSEREFQKERAGQWTKGKSCDTFLPLGPWMLTADAMPDPQNLTLTLDVNGERRQNGHTSDMMFGVGFLVHYLSQFMTLEPGDLICTGTPSGVGMGMNPPQFLREGDTVMLRIAGLGEQRTPCHNA